MTLTPDGESQSCFGSFPGFDAAPTCDPKLSRPQLFVTVRLERP